MDVAVSEVVLNSSEVKPLVGKVVTARVAELVRVNWEIEARLGAEAGDQLADSVVGEWGTTAPVRDEQKRSVRVPALEDSQRPQFHP